MLVLFGLLASLLAISPFTLDARDVPARGYRLVKISVAGSHRFPEARIVQASGLHIGDTVTPDDLQAAANRLGATGAFLSVGFQFRTQGEDLSVAYQVEDGRRFLRCAYDNLVWFTVEEINRAIQQEFVLFDGSLAENDEAASAVTSVLERFLHARGIDGAVTFVKAGELGKPASAYLFKVEGDPVVVASMEVVGPLEASLFSEEQKRIVGKPYSLNFAGLLAEKDLKQVYRNHGYLRAELAEPQATLLGGTQPAGRYQVGVTFHVTPGLQYSWDRADWDGNRVFPKDILDNLLGMQAREIAAADKIARGLDAILTEYGTKGFIQARHSVDQAFNDPAKSVTYHVHLVEGTQFHMGDLVISGLPEAVKREVQNKWRLKPGDIYDASYSTRFLREDLPRILVSARLLNARVKFKVIPNSVKGTVQVEFEFP